MNEPKDEKTEALERSVTRWRLRAADMADALTCAERMLMASISKADVADYIRARRDWWAKQETP